MFLNAWLVCCELSQSNIVWNVENPENWVWETEVGDPVLNIKYVMLPLVDK